MSGDMDSGLARQKNGQVGIGHLAYLVVIYTWTLGPYTALTIGYGSRMAKGGQGRVRESVQRPCTRGGRCVRCRGVLRDGPAPDRIRRGHKKMSEQA